MGKYDDIINMSHPEPKGRPRMSLQNRAAQFSPFAALTGHNEAIQETGRITNEKISLAEDSITDINNRLKWIKDHIKEKPEISLAYYVPDSRKSGGKYIVATKNVIKLDEYSNTITLADGTVVAVHNILNIAFTGA